MSDDKIRLLICHTCGSVEELPYYEGPPERDDTLNYRVSFHRFPDGNEHFGNLGVIKASDWKKQNYKDGVLAELAKVSGKPGTGAGMGQDYYDLKSTFQEDAIACWRSFGKTTNPGHCDYMKENKRLYPDTKGDRKELGLDPSQRPNTFLCQFCPVHSLVMQQQRQKAGQYD